LKKLKSEWLYGLRCKLFNEAIVALNNFKITNYLISMAEFVTLITDDGDFCQK